MVGASSEAERSRRKKQNCHLGENAEGDEKEMFSDNYWQDTFLKVHNFKQSLLNVDDYTAK